MVFSNCKWVFIATLLVLSVSSIFCDESSFLKNIENESQTSESLRNLVARGQLDEVSSVISNLKTALNESDKNVTIMNVAVAGSSDLSETYLEETNKIALEYFINAKAERSHLNVSESFSIHIYLSNNACDILGVKNGVVLPKELSGNGNTSILLRAEYTEVFLKSLVSELMISSHTAGKSEKKLAEADADDLTLKAFTVHINDDLQEVQEEVVGTITITTGGSIRIRANGGSGNYRWRLINDPDDVSRLTTETGSETTYFASNDSRALNSVILSDGFSEIEFKLVYAKILTEKDGTGSKGDNILCFINKKKNNRD